MCITYYLIYFICPLCLSVSLSHFPSPPPSPPPPPHPLFLTFLTLAFTLTPPDKGSSDPYCKMVVLNKKFIEEKIVKKGDIKTWVEEGMVKLENVSRSSVKFKTLEPEWKNETFEL